MSVSDVKHQLILFVCSLRPFTLWPCLLSTQEDIRALKDWSFFELRNEAHLTNVSPPINRRSPQLMVTQVQSRPCGRRGRLAKVSSLSSVKHRTSRVFNRTSTCLGVKNRMLDDKSLLPTLSTVNHLKSTLRRCDTWKPSLMRYARKLKR